MLASRVEFSVSLLAFIVKTKLAIQRPIIIPRLSLANKFAVSVGYKPSAHAVSVDVYAVVSRLASNKSMV